MGKNNTIEPTSNGMSMMVRVAVVALIAALTMVLCGCSTTSANTNANGNTNANTNTAASSKVIEGDKVAADQAAEIAAPESAATAAKASDLKIDAALLTDEKAIELDRIVASPEQSAAQASSSSKKPFYETEGYAVLQEALVDYWTGAEFVTYFDSQANSIVLLLGLPDGEAFLKSLDSGNADAVATWKTIKTDLVQHSQDVGVILAKLGYPEVNMNIILMIDFDSHAAVNEIRAGTYQMKDIILWIVNEDLYHTYL